MKLLLTSAGLTNHEISKAFLAALSKPVSENKVLIVAYAQNQEEEFYVGESKKELEFIGLEKIVVANMHHSLKVADLEECDIVYVCGGNTFAILKKIKETHLFDYISSQVNKGALYVGVSAGSIMAGPNIEIAGWGSEGDKNEVGLGDLRAFNFINISIFPHFREELRDEVEEYRKKVQHQVYELTDRECLFIDRDQIKRIGI